MRARTIAAAVSASLAAVASIAWVASAWFDVSYVLRRQSSVCVLWVHIGALQIDCVERFWGMRESGCRFGRAEGRFIWWPTVRPDPQDYRIQIPLWIPLLPQVVATVLLFRTGRGTPRGTCPTCGYDLTGAPSPTCPECGRECRP